MALLKWTSGDTITERSANNKGIRKGTTTERDAIAAADLELGDVFFNQTLDVTQTLLQKTPDVWGNVGKVPIALDANEVTVTGVTAIEVKNFEYVIDPATLAGFLMNYIVRIKTDNVGTTGTVRFRKDGSGSDDVTVTTTSATFEIQTASFDISGLSDGRHTVEVFMDDGAGDTITMDVLEVWVI